MQGSHSDDRVSSLCARGYCLSASCQVNPRFQTRRLVSPQEGLILILLFSVAPLATGQTVTVVQPGKSLLTSTAIRVQPGNTLKSNRLVDKSDPTSFSSGQSLLLSEPLRKKMKF